MSAAQKSNIGLDVIRGVAALLVVLGHTRSFIELNLSADLTATGWQKALLLPSSFAQESVAVFFVLSGYLVGGQVLREVASRRFGWRVYMSKRLSRLWTVLIPGIVLTFGLDSLTMRLFVKAWDKLAGNASDIGSALCNAAFLQVSRCASYGSNDSLWSLSYEFWFYMIFAGFVVAVWGSIRREWVAAAGGILVSIVSVATFGVGLFGLMPSWLLGVVLAVVHQRWKDVGMPIWLPSSTSRTVLVLTALTGVGMLASNIMAPAEWVRFAIVSIACAPLILVTAARPWGHQSRAARRVSVLGTVSFSLYVFHLPIVKFLVAAYALAGGLSAAGNVVMVYVLATLTFMLCVPLWFITERNTAKVRDWMLRVSAGRGPLAHRSVACSLEDAKSET